MTNELIAKAKECKSAEELLALAKENGYAMTPEEAAATYAELHAEGELSDDELDAASGGACGKRKGDGTPIYKKGRMALVANSRDEGNESDIDLDDTQP